MIKYPLEIEFTNHCSLRCRVCISKNIKNKGYLEVDIYDVILDYIVKNSNDIDYLTIGGLGDNFLHPEIILFLDKLKVLIPLNIPILIPTKGMTINEKVVLKMVELKKLGLQLNIQIGIFSLNKDIQNYLCGLPKGQDYFSRMAKTVKLFKNNRVDFSLELLLTKLSENEINVFNKFCDKLQVDGVVHKLHNFGGRLDNYSSLLSSKDYNAFHCSFNKSRENDENDYYNDLCGFFPYIDFEGNIYPGTHCLHYNLFNIKNIIDKNYNFVIEKCKKMISLENENCKKCVFNSNN